MKLIRWAIPFAALASIGATPVMALPNEPDYSCYLINPCGEAINLTEMCAPSARAKTTPQSQGSSSRTSPRRGRVPQVAMQVYLSNGIWVTSGKVQNQNRQPISNVRVMLEIRDRTGAVQTQNATVEQAVLSPGEQGSFQTGISYASVKQIAGKPLVVPTVRVASVQWANQDGSVGSYP